jgi:hypothetical protein
MRMGGAAIVGAVLTACGVSVSMGSSPGSGVSVTASIAPSPAVSSAPATSTPTAPGYFGATYQDPPSDWTVTGCELLNVAPGSPAADAGLVGAENRTDPVGDVIYAVVVNGTPQPVPNCVVWGNVLARSMAGETLSLSYYHRVVDLFIGHWEAEQTSVTLTAGPCPPPLSGTLSGADAGNRVPLTIRLVGPDGSQTLSAIFDTGGVEPTFANQILQQVGYQATGTFQDSGVVPGASTTAYVYEVPAADLQVWDNGQWVPLATGELQMVGIPNEAFPLVGPSILRHGATFATSGTTWTLQPACAS